MISFASMLNCLIGGLFGGLVATLGVWLWISRAAWRRFMDQPDSRMTAGDFWIVSLRALVTPRFLMFFAVVAMFCAASLLILQSVAASS